MIIAKIDVTKIDKEKMYKGQKGTYLDLILIESRNDKYENDYMVVQGVTKEDREAGVRGAILGNAKIHGQAKQQPAQKPAPKQAVKDFGDDGVDEDVPF